MSTENAPGFAPKSNKPQGFTPKPKADRPSTAAQSEPTAVQPTDLNQVAQSEAMTIRESVNLSAGTGARALQALTVQRDNTQQAIAAEIERLTDPELFFTETMAIAAEKIRSREQQRDQVSFELDFFDVASVTASLPAPRPLPQVQTLKSLSSAG
ncbi:MAG: hypothetical protein LH679_03355 [Cyanobacteria bacterium CAN_BIN43]|nr:hypothetical protein [Cyanobacteria bacterium CAN_BIN43]